MNKEYHGRLLAERTFLQRLLAKTPATARLTRMSDEARLKKVESLISQLSEEANKPARARLTFSGAPVVNSHGIFADFAMKAVSSFKEVVESVAASLSKPLAAVGPIPNRDQSRLLITNTAVGSFGFDLEEYQVDELPLNGISPVATALERTQALLKSTLGDDEELADVVSETDLRALDRVRTFLKVLADNRAVCTLKYGRGEIRFTDVEQVKRSLGRLAEDNLHETPETLYGQFTGVLPQGLSFEFKLTDNSEIIRGKIDRQLQDVDELNSHLKETVKINVIKTQVGNGRPRYKITEMPMWNLS